MNQQHPERQIGNFLNRKGSRQILFLIEFLIFSGIFYYATFGGGFESSLITKLVEENSTKLVGETFVDILIGLSFFIAWVITSVILYQHTVHYREGGDA